MTLAYIHKPIRELEHVEKKALKALFREYGLELESFVVGKSVNFLDVSFDLRTEDFKPYRKPESDILYVHSESNHAECVLNEIPKSIGNRLSTLSSNNQIFDRYKTEYENALNVAGYGPNKSKIQYTPKDIEVENAERQNRENRKRRNRRIIWFTPPWNIQVRTNIGKEFFKILDESFEHADLKRLFNRNTVKLGYSTTRNFEQIIKGHNLKANQQNETLKSQKCNCDIPAQCPLNGECQQENVIYRANVVETENEDVVIGEYIGCTDNFKIRFGNHKKSLNHERYRNETDLSKFIWSKRDEGVTTKIFWSIMRKAPTYRSGSHLCCLCSLEKVLIIEQKKKAGNKVLNERLDMCRKCPHKIKARLV